MNERREQVEVLRLELTQRRRWLGIDQTTLAERMGVSQGAVSQLEQDASPKSRVETFARWAGALGGRLLLRVEWDEVDELAELAWRAASPFSSAGVDWEDLVPEQQDRWRSVARAVRNVQ